MNTRYIPQNATPISEPGLGTVYVFPIKSPAGYYGVIAYREKATKSAFCSAVRFRLKR